MNSEQKVLKPQIPFTTVLGAVLIGVLLFVFVIFAVKQTGKPINQALMRGTITEKQFLPAKAPEAQITIGRNGQFLARTVEGEFILTVEVPVDGVKKEYKVYMPDREQYDKYKVGDTFDVGPYLIPPDNSAPAAK